MTSVRRTLLLPDYVCIMHEVSNSLSEEESRKENKNSERINAKPSKAVFALPHF